MKWRDSHLQNPQNFLKHATRGGYAVRYAPRRAHFMPSIADRPPCASIDRRFDTRGSCISAHVMHACIASVSAQAPRPSCAQSTQWLTINVLPMSSGVSSAGEVTIVRCFCHTHGRRSEWLRACHVPTTYRSRTGHVPATWPPKCWTRKKGRALEFSNVRLADIFAVNIDDLL